jgi:competence protein ComGC
MAQNKGVTLVELLLVIAIFVTTFILLTPLVNKMKDRSNDIKCSNNISLISLALHMYAADHDEAFPPGLSALYPDYIKEEKVFDCPASGPRGTVDRCDYEYIALLSENSSPTDVIVYDRDFNHKNRGRNIVRVNGSVEWVRGIQGRPK